MGAGFGTNESMTLEVRNQAQAMPMHEPASGGGAVGGGGAAGGGDDDGEARVRPFDRTARKAVHQPSRLGWNVPASSMATAISDVALLEPISRLFGLQTSNRLEWQCTEFSGYKTGPKHFNLAGVCRRVSGECRIFTCVVYTVVDETEPYVVYSLLKKTAKLYHNRLKEFLENLRVPDIGTAPTKSDFTRYAKLDAIIQKYIWSFTPTTVGYSVNEEREIRTIFAMHYREFPVYPPALEPLMKYIKTALKVLNPPCNDASRSWEKAARVAFHACCTLVDRIVTEAEGAAHSQCELFDFVRFCEHILQENTRELHSNLQRVGAVWDIVFELFAESGAISQANPWFVRPVLPSVELLDSGLSVDDGDAPRQRGNSDDLIDPDELDDLDGTEMEFVDRVSKLMHSLLAARNKLQESMAKKLAFRIELLLANGDVVDAVSDNFNSQVIKLLNGILKVVLDILDNTDDTVSVFTRLNLKQVIPHTLHRILAATELFPPAFINGTGDLIRKLFVKGHVVFKCVTSGRDLAAQVGEMLFTISDQTDYELPPYNYFLRKLVERLPRGTPGPNALKELFDDMVRAYDDKVAAQQEGEPVAAKRKRSRPAASGAGDPNFQGRLRAPAQGEAVEGRSTRAGGAQTSAGPSSGSTATVGAVSGETSSSALTAAVLTDDGDRGGSGGLDPARSQLAEAMPSLAESRHKRNLVAPTRYSDGNSSQLSSGGNTLKTGMAIPGINAARTSPIDVIYPQLSLNDVTRRISDMPLHSPRTASLAIGTVRSLNKLRLLDVLQENYYALILSEGRLFYVAVNLLTENSVSAQTLVGKSKTVNVVITDYHRKNGVHTGAIFVCHHSTFKSQISQDVIEARQRHIKECVSGPGLISLLEAAQAGGGESRGRSGSRKDGSRGHGRGEGREGRGRGESRGRGRGSSSGGGFGGGSGGSGGRSRGRALSSSDEALDEPSSGEEEIFPGSAHGMGDGVPTRQTLQIGRVSASNYDPDSYFMRRLDYDCSGDPAARPLTFLELVRECSIISSGDDGRRRRHPMAGTFRESGQDDTADDADYQPEVAVPVDPHCGLGESVLLQVDEDKLRAFVSINPTVTFYYLWLKPETDICRILGIPGEPEQPVIDSSDDSEASCPETETVQRNPESSERKPNVFLIIGTQFSAKRKVPRSVASIIATLLGGVLDPNRRMVFGPVEAQISTIHGRVAIGGLTFAEILGKMAGPEFIVNGDTMLHDFIANEHGVARNTCEFMNINALCVRQQSVRVRRGVRVQVPTFSHACMFREAGGLLMMHIRTREALQSPQLFVSELPTLIRPICYCLSSRSLPVKANYTLYGNKDTDLPGHLTEGARSRNIIFFDDGSFYSINTNHDGLEALGSALARR